MPNYDTQRYVTSQRTVNEAATRRLLEAMQSAYEAMAVLGEAQSDEVSRIRDKFLDDIKGADVLGREVVITYEGEEGATTANYNLGGAHGSFRQGTIAPGEVIGGSLRSGWFSDGACFDLEEGAYVGSDKRFTFPIGLIRDIPTAQPETPVVTLQVLA